MDYRAIGPTQREAMLHAVGVSTVEDLFADLPADLLLREPLEGVGESMGEMELCEHLSSLASTNVPASREISFMGAGAYDHYIPSIVDHVLRRPEIFTAYTPYQPEVSQGTLQAIFEFQTAVCELTGMEVANAGLYDGATASVEALLMAARIKKRERVLVSSALHPQWKETIATYGKLGVMQVEFVDPGEISSVLDDSCACVLVANPDFLGRITSLEPLRDAATKAGALLAVAINPLLQAVVETPGSQGADIVVGEGQPLGLPMNFGGPGIGLFACKQSFIRQMPGRLAGRALDASGNEGFVLTLSTREQHIRREKATSNICSNQTLCATAMGIHLAALGKTGLVQTATLCVGNAHYLHDALLKTGLFERCYEDVFGYEFAVRFVGNTHTAEEGIDAPRLVELMRGCGVLAGVIPHTLDASYDPDIMLFAVTEKRTRGEIDYFVSEVETVCQ